MGFSMAKIRRQITCCDTYHLFKDSLIACKIHFKYLKTKDYLK